LNWRARKVDFHGAGKLVIPFFVCYAAWKFLSAHVSLNLSLEDLCWAAISAAGINAGIIWVFYLALEPWVRRRWPQTMI
jgi:hypothetical protein